MENNEKKSKSRQLTSGPSRFRRLTGRMGVGVGDEATKVVVVLLMTSSSSTPLSSPAKKARFVRPSNSFNCFRRDGMDFVSSNSN